MMEIKTVKDIAKFIRTGKTPPTQEIKYFNGEVNWYTPGDLDKGKYLSSAKRTLTKDAFVDKKAVVFPKNTLIVGCIGDIGKLGITVDECSSNQQLTGIFPNENVDVSYLYYWFRGNKSLIESYANNAVVPILNNRTLETIKIPLPQLPQQQKIAAILDAADALRQNDKALVAKYDELTQALFLDMFGDPVSNPNGWEIKTLSEVCNKITDGTHQGPQFIDSGIPFLLVSNIVNNEINFNTKKYISEKEYSLLTKSTPIEKGDLLYTSVGSYGNPAIVKDSRKFCFQRHIAHLKPNHEVINIVFLHAIMASPLVTWQADRFAIGAAQKTLNLKVIKAFKVFLPSMKVQNQFAERISVIEEQKAIAQASLIKSEELFNSLLQKAFKGRVSIKK